ncbi:hypothetical protein [Enterococcus sp.]|uniref:hypothetical protein n=1 Tax=Enterococcus sp. TaxID=35783 RepID=UPI002FC8DF61
MKAYIVNIENDADVGSEVIFAENTKEARKLAHKTEIAMNADNYIDVRTKRAPEFDGMENTTSKEMYKKMWQGGWWFHQSGCPSREASEKEFDDWYKKTYEGVTE